MITYVAKVINLVASTVQNVILIASLIGELIISAILWICAFILNVVNNMKNFFCIVYEDNIGIFTDVPNSTREVVESTLDQFLCIKNGIEKALSYICYEIGAIIRSVAWFFNAVYLIISEVLILLVNTVFFMGETTWLIITFIPVHLTHLLRSSAKYIVNVAVNATIDGYMRLLKFTNYLTEVPLESFLGITSAIIIVRLCVHFKDSILNHMHNFYVSSIRNILYLYHACFNYFTNPEVQVITQLAGGDVMSSREMLFEDANDATGADALCVICQERQKCVLTLPCRHLCLCTECCRRLYSYQRTCPICRTFIYHSVTVYL